MEGFSWEAYRGNWSQLKRLLEGKEFSVDVKYRDPKLICVTVPIICVTNEWFLGDEAFSRRFRIIEAKTPCLHKEKEVFAEVKEEAKCRGEEVVCLSSDEEEGS
jgi:hypothetical protein